MAPLVLVLFLLGLYMVTLDYTHPWYQSAPELHRSLGVLTGLLLVPRWLWRQLDPLPAIEGRRRERVVALSTHRLLYLLLALTVTSGYLIATADGRPLALFDLLEIPALPVTLENQEETAGSVHRWAAYTLAALSVLHALAALKHHFIDRDATLRRMLGTSPRHLSARQEPTTSEE